MNLELLVTSIIDGVSVVNHVSKQAKEHSSQGGKLLPEDSIRMWEEKLKLEANHCARMAYYHQNAKETVVALRLKIKEVKARIKEEAKPAEK